MRVRTARSLDVAVVALAVVVVDGRWRENINSHIMKTKRTYLKRRSRRRRRCRRSRPVQRRQNHWSVARAPTINSAAQTPFKQIRSWNILGAHSRRA